MRTPLATLAVLLCSLAAAASAGASTNDPLRPQQYGMDIIEADAAHTVTTGAGAVVAVIDTGVLASHEDLQGRLVPGYDIVDDDPTPQDGEGHGTHVTGIVVANANNRIGVEGAAPGAKVMPIRVLDDSGSGTPEDVAKGIDYAVAHGANVINLSLGPDALGFIAGGDDPALTAAIDRAVKANVVVVAAAGNDSLPLCEQPSVEGEILCVGSVDENRMRSFFSSSGNITAPGGSALAGPDILSTFNDGKYTEMAGTSQAAPHVAGVAALLVSLGLHGDQVVKRIIATADHSGPPSPDGTGIVNARAAVAGLGGATGTGGGGTGGGSGNGTTGGGSTANGGGARVGISYRRTQKIRTVRRRGVRVRCTAAANGRCRVRVTAAGRTIATGSRKVAAGRRVYVAAKLNSAGRRLLRGKRRQRARISAAVPGASKRATGRLTLVR